MKTIKEESYLGWKLFGMIVILLAIVFVFNGFSFPPTDPNYLPWSLR